MLRASTLAIALALPLFVASCATLEQWPASGNADAVTSTDLLTNGPEMAMLAARMEQLEQDMAEVRIEMSRILPAIQALNANQGMNEPNRIGAVTANPDDVPTAVSEAETRFAIHLASYRNREGAIEGWYELQGRFGPVLNSLEPRVAQVNIEGRGTFYRLKAGPFTNWGSANEVCDYLRGESWSCAVMDFTGEETG